VGWAAAANGKAADATTSRDTKPDLSIRGSMRSKKRKTTNVLFWYAFTVSKSVYKLQKRFLASGVSSAQQRRAVKEASFNILLKKRMAHKKAPPIGGAFLII
jgi:hypothetical protein